MSFFCVDSVTSGYGKGNIIENISFRMEKGSMTGILGANGSGKTTLLKSVCGILPHSGSCTLEGVKLETLSARQLARIVSYIPQRSGISIDISALDVVLMGFNSQLKLLEQPTKGMTDAAMDALIDRGFDPVYGARPLKRYLQSRIETLIARRIIAADVEPGTILKVDLDENGEFTVGS